VRRGARQLFLRAPGRAGRRRAKELLGWIAPSKPNYNTLPKQPHVSPSPALSGGKASEGAARLDRILQHFLPKRYVAPCWVKAEESAFASPERKGELKPAALGTRFKVRCGVLTTCSSLPRRRNKNKASEGAAGLERVLQAEIHYLVNAFPARQISCGQGLTAFLHVCRPGQRR
jgi:hypothetical protein